MFQFICHISRRPFYFGVEVSLTRSWLTLVHDVAVQLTWNYILEFTILDYVSSIEFDHQTHLLERLSFVINVAYILLKAWICIYAYTLGAYLLGEITNSVPLVRAYFTMNNRSSTLLSSNFRIHIYKQCSRASSSSSPSSALAPPFIECWSSLFRAVFWILCHERWVCVCVCTRIIFAKASVETSACVWEERKL